MNIASICQTMFSKVLENTGGKKLLGSLHVGIVAVTAVIVLGPD